MWLNSSFIVRQFEVEDRIPADPGELAPALDLGNLSLGGAFRVRRGEQLHPEGATARYAASVGLILRQVKDRVTTVAVYPEPRHWNQVPQPLVFSILEYGHRHHKSMWICIVDLLSSRNVNHSHAPSLM